MFCWYCKAEFNQFNTANGVLINGICPSCFSIKKSSIVCIFPQKNRHCIKCGAELPGQLIDTSRGKKWHTKGNRFFCFGCKPQESEPKRRACIVCGILIDGRAHKYCTEHKPKPKYCKDAHRRAALAWQKRNPEKAKCSRKAVYHAHKVNVIYECRCQTEKKVNHHFDYSRPFDVIRICPACHSHEHKRIRRSKIYIKAQKSSLTGKPTGQRVRDRRSSDDETRSASPQL